MLDDPSYRWTNQRVRTPTVLQMEAVECGAAALAMVLAYHGRQVPLEQLRVDCGVSRDGSKASNILLAARKYGLVAKGHRHDVEQLHGLPLPQVLFWNFNHFVVLEGIRGKRIYLNDPATGPRTVTSEELEDAFTGVVLAFEPGPEFQPGGHRPRLLTALAERLAGYRDALLFALLAGLALVVPGLVVPTFSRIFVDSVLIDRDLSWSGPLLLSMGAVALLLIALTWFQQTVLLRFQVKLSLVSSAAFFQHVLRLPMEFFAQRFGGEVGNRIQYNDRVAQLLSGDLATNAISVLMILFYPLLMFQYDALLTLLGISIAAVNLVGLAWVSRQRIDTNQRLRNERGKLLGVSMNGLQQIETLKATGAEADFFARWSGYQAKVVNARQDLGVPTTALNVLPTLLTGINTLAILAVGGLRVIEGHLTMGELVAFQALMAAFLTPVNQLLGVGPKLQDAHADINRLNDVLRNPQESRFSKVPATGDVATPPLLAGHVEIAGVSFGYSRLEPPLIEDFNLRLAPGARVALVGASGSGKSTIARLVAGLYTPWSGEVRFDGQLREAIPEDVMNNSLAVVDQDIFMFEGTVRDNLTLWDTTIREADLLRASRDACIHDDLSGRALGYDASVIEGGANFSGGQRQRLEIARALAGNPRVLIMDEATSALDPQTESRVDQNIRHRGCTCLIVAHRLSTIRDCDEIIVLEHGHVVQRGTHDEMREIDGPYARLIQAS